MTPHQKLRLKNLKVRIGQRRCYALEYLGEGRIRWQCQRGHEFVHQIKRWRLNGTLDKTASVALLDEGGGRVQRVLP